MALLAPLAGVEPATYRLGGGCSILLSYKGTCLTTGAIVAERRESRVQLVDELEIKRWRRIGW